MLFRSGAGDMRWCGGWGQGGCAHLAEDDALPDGEQVVQPAQHIVFRLLRLAVHIELLDALYRQLLLLELNFVGVRSKLVREVPYSVRECCREEHDLRRSVLGQETIAKIRWLFILLETPLTS